MLYASARQDLVNHYGRNGVECEIFLYGGAIYIYPAPIACLVSLPVGMNIDVGYTSGIVFFFKTAVLKGDVLYLADFTSEIVIDVKGKAVVFGNVLCYEGENIINGFSLVVAYILRKSVLLKPLPSMNV